MKKLTLKWQRLVYDGATCPRCGSTEREIGKAVTALRQAFRPLGIEVVLQEDELSVTEFQEDPLQSNQIWINGQPLEDLVGGRIGQSPCCDVCGPSECRTVEIEGNTYETIPAGLVIKAALIAASKLVTSDAFRLPSNS